MNRLVLIGNGFDLAHGLKTSYADFINWYWDRRMIHFNNDHTDFSDDSLCRFKILNDKIREHETWSTIAYRHNYFNSNPSLGVEYIGKDVIATIIADTDHYETKFSPFFEKIIKSIETKGWVDIEQDYYDLLKEYALDEENYNDEAKRSYINSLNKQLDYIKSLLIQYLKEITKAQPEKIKSVENAIYAPFVEEDISIKGEGKLKEHKKYWEELATEAQINDKIVRYGLRESEVKNWIQWYRESKDKYSVSYPPVFLLPDYIMFLNFNYTNTTEAYKKNDDSCSDNHIHGNIDDSASVIFGYGDELDEDFRKLKSHKNNECLRDVKSILYQQAPNYRAVLRFIESAPFQVLIMGHSCGNSDRTLLNTIFEHPNCVSIKPYYYVKEDGTDNYIELVQNISRNFTDMKLMRDRVVNKIQCEPLVKE